MFQAIVGLGTQRSGLKVVQDRDPCYGQFARNSRRLCEAVRCKPHFTQFIVWIRALQSARRCFHFRTGFRKVMAYELILCFIWVTAHAG